jgi:aryl-alcohol dehydrogenase-like predicted oxidoreductase
MDYVNLGQSGLRVSRLCLGTMTFGSSQWRHWVLDEAASTPVIQAAVERGINFIDLADFYSLGVSEEVVGRALKHVPRHKLVLASKCYYAMSDDVNDQGLSRQHILHAVDASLKRIGTDYLDLFVIHAFDPNVPIEETMKALDDVVRSGKVRYIGASTMYAWQFVKMNYIAKLNGWTPFVSMQCQLNAAYREEEREMIPYCQSEGIGVTPFSPLARGLLSGNAESLRNKTDGFTQSTYNDETSFAVARAVADVAHHRGVSSSQVALSWTMSRPGVTSTLIGVENIAQLDESIAAMSLSLTAQELYDIDRHYTPCDVINDHRADRIPRFARPAAQVSV